MIRRNRFLILGFLVTAVIIMLCLGGPGVLLKVEKASDVGKVASGKQQYYADDVADDSLHFDFSRRLMMISGQWKSSPEEVEYFEGLLNPEIMTALGDFFYYFLAECVSYGYGQSWQDYAAAKLYGEAYPEGGFEYYEYNSILSDRQQAGLNYICECVDKGTALTLYRYSDKVFNSFEFYVWEYAIKAEHVGLDFRVLIDALTMDIYSIELSGDFFERIDFADLFIYLRDSNHWPKYVSVEDFSPYAWDAADDLYQPMTLWYACYEECINAIQNSYPSDFMAMMNYDSKDSAYTFLGGNFVCCKISKCDYISDFVYEFLSQGDPLYGYLDFSQGVALRFTGDKDIALGEKR